MTYPKKVRFALAKKGEKDTGARVWVDMMDEIARQAGQEDGSQSVIIRLDWSGVAFATDNQDGTKKPGLLPVQPMNGQNRKNPSTGEAPLWAPLAGLAVSAAASAAALISKRRKK